jgi:hypothetical protein
LIDLVAYSAYSGRFPAPADSAHHPSSPNQMTLAGGRTPTHQYSPTPRGAKATRSHIRPDRRRPLPRSAPGADHLRELLELRRSGPAGPLCRSGRTSRAAPQGRGRGDPVSKKRRLDVPPRDVMNAPDRPGRDRGVAGERAIADPCGASGDLTRRSCGRPAPRHGRGHAPVDQGDLPNLRNRGGGDDREPSD